MILADLVLAWEIALVEDPKATLGIFSVSFEPLDTCHQSRLSPLVSLVQGPPKHTHWENKGYPGHWADFKGLQTDPNR